jgi:hypothetical protein
VPDIETTLGILRLKPGMMVVLAPGIISSRSTSWITASPSSSTTRLGPAPKAGTYNRKCLPHTTTSYTLSDSGALGVNGHAHLGALKTPSLGSVKRDAGSPQLEIITVKLAGIWDSMRSHFGDNIEDANASSSSAGLDSANASHTVWGCRHKTVKSTHQEAITPR